MEVFKSLHDLNPIFMKEMFNIKELQYSLRDSNIIYTHLRLTNDLLKEYI